MAIAENPNMQALLDNAVIYVSEYEGKLQMKKDKSPVLAGQFTLVGDMEIDGTKIKYSVFTPFIVENHRFTKFGLTEQELKRFLYDVVQSPVTRRMLIYYPDMTLNLWYVAESDESEPEMPQLLLIFEKSKSINPANQF
jgi:hypothetical protein